MSHCIGRMCLPSSHKVLTLLKVIAGPQEQSQAVLLRVKAMLVESLKTWLHHGRHALRHSSDIG